MLDGTAGDDLIYGFATGDRIDGFAGDDFIYGESGNDELIGGEGNDNLNGGFGDDLLRGDAGDDSLSGGDGDDTLFGGDGNDTLGGDWGNDSAYGGAGNDYLRAEIMVGGTGDDFYWMDSGAESIVELANEGIDTVWVSLPSYTLGDNLENAYISTITGRTYAVNGNSLDNTFYIEGSYSLGSLPGDNTGITIIDGAGGVNTVSSGGHVSLSGGSTTQFFLNIQNLEGGSGGDSLTGDSQNNRLSGGGGNDYLYGLDGDDVLIGGVGSDIMVGGMGNDTYVWGRGYGDDHLSDDGGLDKVVLVNLVQADVTFVEDPLSIGFGSFWLQIRDTGERLYFGGPIVLGGPARPVETIEFSDGTTWLMDDLLAQLVPGDIFSSTATH